MNTTTLKTKLSPLYSAYRVLYENSFPLFEQRTLFQESIAFDSPNYFLDIFEQDDVFIGFISYWEFETYIYIEHFAVNSTIRGTGYGTLVLTNFIAQTPKRIVLEIDPIVDTITSARLRFYKACGFSDNIHLHTHPPYREGCAPHSLVLLTTDGDMSDEFFQKFNSDLADVIMNFDF